jgi:hypothetical protein
VVVKKINPQDGETHGGEEECPLAGNSGYGNLERLLSPAGNAAAIRARQSGSGRRRRPPRHVGDGGAGVDQKSAVKGTVRYKEEAAGANRRNNAPAA